MSRKSAYRLRALPGAESFAAAWDAALGARPRKVTPPARDFLDCRPLVRLVMFRGQIAERGATPPMATWCRRFAGGIAPARVTGATRKVTAPCPQAHGLAATAMASATIRTIRTIRATARRIRRA